MSKCVVKECDSRSQKHNKIPGITFHTLPKDAARRDKWVEMIRLLRRETNWLPTKSTVICSKHFRDQDKIGPITVCGRRVHLSNEAIPMLIDNCYSEEQVELSIKENMGVNAVETDKEIEEKTESPRKHKMRKIIHPLENLSAGRLRKIKNIPQKNKRPELKIKKIKDIIEELQKKRMLNEEDEMQLNVNDIKKQCN